MPEHDDAPAPAGDGVDHATRERLRASLLRPSRSQIVVGVLLALVGFAAVTQVRDNQVDSTYAGLREQDLIDVFNGLSGARQRAEADLAELEQTRDELLSTSDRREAAIEQAESEADTLRILAGLVPVTGSGVQVTIKEVDGQISLGSLLDVIQELRVADAEAMQINGKVRIVADTAFEDAEGGFLVDGQLVSPPYIIDAIGEPDVLEGAIDFIGGPKRTIEAEGGEIDAEPLPSLDIDSVAERREPQHAEPVTTE